MPKELLAALKERLAYVEVNRAGISQQMAALEHAAAGFSEESAHLRALIDRLERGDTGTRPPPAPPAAEVPRPAPVIPALEPEPAAAAVSPAPEAGGARWLASAVEVLGRESGPLHYRELFRKMKSMGGPSFGGQNPVATFLSMISREAAKPDGAFVRAGRGEYALRDHAPAPPRRRTPRTASKSAGAKGKPRATAATAAPKNARPRRGRAPRTGSQS